jgi:hypothetical protein
MVGEGAATKIRERATTVVIADEDAPRDLVAVVDWHATEALLRVTGICVLGPAPPSPAPAAAKSPAWGWAPTTTLRLGCVDVGPPVAPVKPMSTVGPPTTAARFRVVLVWNWWFVVKSTSVVTRSCRRTPGWTGSGCRCSSPRRRSNCTTQTGRASPGWCRWRGRRIHYLHTQRSARKWANDRAKTPRASEWHRRDVSSCFRRSPTLDAQGESSHHNGRCASGGPN